jgi:hypothetical protein
VGTGHRGDEAPEILWKVLKFLTLDYDRPVPCSSPGLLEMCSKGDVYFEVR